MEKQNDNRDQIIRKDARNCFVEVKNDCFHLDKVHLQFVAYDKSRPAGQRYTSNIHIYIDVPQFLALAQEAANGSLHMRMQQYKNERKSDALYEHLGGTSAKRLAYYGKSRPDGKSLSRVVKLTTAEKSDYFLTADSGPGEENKTGLIVPRFGKSPEQHVSVVLTWRQLNELLFTTAAHYKAWLSARYMADWTAIHAPRFEEGGQRKGQKRQEAASEASPARQPGPPRQRRRLHRPQPQRKPPVSAVLLAVFMAVQVAVVKPMTGGCFSGILILSILVQAAGQQAGKAT